jgi:hypothetical protein
MVEVPEDVLKKLASYYNLHKHGETSDVISPWIRNINNMSKMDLEYEGERLIPIKSKREKLMEELQREWTYMSFYLYTLFIHSGIEVSEDDFDEYLREETGSRSFITNLTAKR